MIELKELLQDYKLPEPIGARINHWAQLVNGLFQLVDFFEAPGCWVDDEVTSETRDHLEKAIELAFNLYQTERWTTDIGYPITLANMHYIAEYWERRFSPFTGDDSFIRDLREIPYLIKETNRLIGEYNYHRSLNTYK